MSLDKKLFIGETTRISKTGGRFDCYEVIRDGFMGIIVSNLDYTEENDKFLKKAGYKYKGIFQNTSKHLYEIEMSRMSS